MLSSERVWINPVSENEMEALLEVYRGCEDFLALGPVATASAGMVLADLALSRKAGGRFCGIYEKASGKMIGVVDYISEGWDGIASQAFLELLMIALPYRSRGFGEEVVRLVEAAICRDGKVQQIAAGVQVNNPGAIRFWQRMGYKIVSGPKQYADGTTAYDLLKHIRDGNMEADLVMELNEHFAIPGHLQFMAGQGGLVTASINNEYASGEITLAGAHVTSFTPKFMKKPVGVLWMSAKSPHQVGKALRGGIPLCWPWFGAHPANPERYPAHGFARTVVWEMCGARVLPDGSTEVRLGLRDSDETRALWPHEFALEYIVTFGQALRVDLKVLNPGRAAFQYTGALHHYFHVSDVAQVTVLGLEGCDYLDKPEGFARKHQQGSIRFQGQTDRVYLDTISDSVIVDPQWGRKIRIAKESSRTTVVWNPGDAAGKMADVGEGGQVNFVCVETANAADDIISVPPGSESHLAALITIEEFDERPVSHEA